MHVGGGGEVGQKTKNKEIKGEFINMLRSIQDSPLCFRCQLK